MKNANGEGSIRKIERNGKPYYIGQMTIGFDANGKQIRKTFGNVKKTVVVQKMQAAQTETINKFFLKDKITFSEAFEVYLQNKKPSITQNTYFCIEQSYRNNVKDSFLAGMELKNIKKAHIQALLDETIIVRKWKINTAKSFTKDLSGFFSWAIDNDLISKNPCLRLNYPLESKKSKERVYSLDEQNKLFEVMDLKNARHLAIFVDFFTGLRFGELVALKWSDLNDNKLSINKQLAVINEYDSETNSITRHLQEAELKTKASYREVYLPDKVLVELKKHRVTQMKKIQWLKGNYKGDLLIFANDDGTPFLNGHLNFTLKQLCKKAGIEFKSFHAIRHSYATRLFENDAKVKTVQTLMGHSDIKTTLNIYTHVSKKEKENASELLNFIVK